MVLFHNPFLGWRVGDSAGAVQIGVRSQGVVGVCPTNDTLRWQGNRIPGTLSPGVTVSTTTPLCPVRWTLDPGLCFCCLPPASRHPGLANTIQPSPRDPRLPLMCPVLTPAVNNLGIFDDEGDGITATCAARPTCGECGAVRLTGADAAASSAGDLSRAIGWCKETPPPPLPPSFLA